MMVLYALLIITSISLCTVSDGSQDGDGMSNAASTSWLKLSGARTGRPPSLLVELQVKKWVGLASWLSVVDSARQGDSAPRQVLTPGERNRSCPHKVTDRNSD